MMDQRFAVDISKVGPIVDHALPLRESPHEFDWSRAIRSLDRKRRAVGRTWSGVMPDWAYSDATLVSFSLEGIEVSLDELTDSLTPRQQGRAFRSRQRQRIRNHLAILRVIDRNALRSIPHNPGSLLRWYTSISSGLSTSNLAAVQSARGRDIVRRINSPQLRLQAAIQEIAQLHCELLAEPIFPSFNGILARLILRAHLARCGLPPVLFSQQVDNAHTPTPTLFMGRLIQLLEQSFERLRLDIQNDIAYPPTSA